MNLLDQMERRAIISDDGRRWLEAALDPFHDFELSPPGLPDSDTSRVVIEQLNESLQISAPAGTSANWDAHVFSLPIQYINGGTVFSPSTLLTGGVMERFVDGAGATASVYVSPGVIGATFVGTDAVRQLGLLNVDTFSSPGGPLAPAVGVSYTRPAATAVLGGVGVPMFGKRRLIAAAFEVHDTTALLSKQGTLTAYRMPQAEADVVGVCDSFVNNPPSSTSTFAYCQPNPALTTGTATNSVAGNVQQQLYRVFNTPPPTVATAMLYPGSRQWEMKDGAYVVLSQDAERNILRFTDDRHLAFTSGDYIPQNVGSYPFTRPASTTCDAWASQTWVANPAPLVSGSGASTSYDAANLAPPDFLPLPFHTSGLMLTGLNAASTFTVTLRTFWEIAPVTGDFNASLVPLARPSPELDLIALELYQRAVTKLPVAVPVAMNAEGDFWDWCLRALSAAAAPVAGALLGGPAGVAVGAAASAGLGAVRTKRNARADLADRAAQATIDNFKPNAKPGNSGGGRASSAPPTAPTVPARTMASVTPLQLQALNQIAKKRFGKRYVKLNDAEKKQVWKLDRA